MLRGRHLRSIPKINNGDWISLAEKEHFVKRWSMGQTNITKLKDLETYVFAKKQDLASQQLNLTEQLKKIQEKIADKTEQLEMLSARERESVERLYDVVINIDVDQESDFDHNYSDDTPYNSFLHLHLLLNLINS